MKIIKYFKLVLITSLYGGIWILCFYNLKLFISNFLNLNYFREIVALFLSGLISCILFLIGSYTFSGFLTFKLTNEVKKKEPSLVIRLINDHNVWGVFSGFFVFLLFLFFAINNGSFILNIFSVIGLFVGVIYLKRFMNN